MSTATATEAPARTGIASLQALERLALPGLLILVVIFFSVFPASRDIFPTSANISVVLGNQSVVLLVAAAMLFPLVAGHFDFSAGATAIFASLVAAAGMASFHLPTVVACLAALVAGVLIGTVNGLVVARFRMNAFVSTLGMATLLGGLIQWYTGGLAIVGISRGMTDFGSSSLLGLPRVVYLVAVLLLAAWYVLAHTPYGRSLYALGSNERAAVLVGIPRRRYTLIAFVVCSLLASVAGVIVAARTGGANPENGTSLLFPALTAAFLGTTGFQPGRFNVLGTVVGVLFVAASVSGLTLSGAESWVDQVFNGVALLVAVGLSSYLRRNREGASA
jgi:ribose transport system permease protein